MVERKLVDNLIDGIKDKYWCRTKATNNGYDSLNITRKTNGLIHKNELPELHNLIELLMKIEKLISDQQEIDTARKDTDMQGRSKK